MPSLIPLSATDRDEVIRLFDAQGLIHAVLYVRRVTGANLADADLTLRTLLHEAGRLPPPEKNETRARILAIGPYRRDILPDFDFEGFPPHKATREGTPVVVHLCEAYKGDEDVRALAACFHTDPWDFNTHAFDPWRADLEALRALDDGGDGLVDQFVALREAGFQFHFCLAPEKDPARELREAFNVLHMGVPRGAPGNDDGTRRALHRLRPLLPPSPRVLDLGCGPGRQTLLLARELAVPITAVDMSALYLEQLETEAASQGLGHLIQTRCMDPGALEEAPGRVDLIWSEGALHLLGWAEALRRWRPLLRSGGLLAVTEATWLPDAPPSEPIDVWRGCSQTLGTVASHGAMAHEAGYEVLETFVLPASAWWDEHYRLLEACVASFRERARRSTALDTALAMSERELALYARHGESYGYVFYLLRAHERGSALPRPSGA